MSSPPLHTGILRDELLALRYILGYSDEPPASAFPSLSHVSLLNGSRIRDILLVSVDIETNQGCNEIQDDQAFRLGISVLDTRRLQEIIADSSLLDQQQDAIKSNQFLVGQSRYVEYARKFYLFSESDEILLSDFKSRFESLVQGREYALVGHGLHEDLKILRQLDIGSQARCVIDTVKAAQFPLQLSSRITLERLLCYKLKIPYLNLHKAGNDAHFALRAALMLAVKDLELQHAEINGTLPQTLVAIARLPLRPWSKETPEEAAEGTVAEPKPKKLSIYAKRRARAERKRLKKEGQQPQPQSAGEPVLISQMADGDERGEDLQDTEAGSNL